MWMMPAQRSKPQAVAFFRVVEPLCSGLPTTTVSSVCVTMCRCVCLLFVARLAGPCPCTARGVGNSSRAIALLCVSRSELCHDSCGLTHIVCLLLLVFIQMSQFRTRLSAVVCVCITALCGCPAVSPAELGAAGVCWRQGWHTGWPSSCQRQAQCTEEPGITLCYRWSRFRDICTGRGWFLNVWTCGCHKLTW
jgi:hypothetical protein